MALHATIFIFSTWISNRTRDNSKHAISVHNHPSNRGICHSDTQPVEFKQSKSDSSVFAPTGAPHLSPDHFNGVESSESAITVLHKIRTLQIFKSHIQNVHKIIISLSNLSCHLKTRHAAQHTI
jgi:hypothetical protein